MEIWFDRLQCTLCLQKIPLIKILALTGMITKEKCGNNPLKLPVLLPDKRKSNTHFVSYFLATHKIKSNFFLCTEL